MIQSRVRKLCGKFGPPSAFVNKVILEQCHTCLFTLSMFRLPKAMFCVFFKQSRIVSTGHRLQSL